MEFFTTEILLALITLTALEIVLGIDNIIFISILTSRLPVEQQQSARRTGLIIAMVSRLLFLFSIFWIIGFTSTLFTVFGNDISGRDVILIIGGLFLLTKSTNEIFNRVEEAGRNTSAPMYSSYAVVMAQVAVIDIVFSIDSVITAIGMSEHVGVMATAITISVGVMIMFANAIADFIDRHPSIKILALSFLILIAVALIGDGLDTHINKGYIYFAMFYAFSVEAIQMAIRDRQNKANTREVRQ